MGLVEVDLGDETVLPGRARPRSGARGLALVGVLVAIGAAVAVGGRDGSAETATAPATVEDGAPEDGALEDGARAADGPCDSAGVEGGVQIGTATPNRLVCQQWAGSPSGGVLSAVLLDVASGEVVARSALVTSGGAYFTVWDDLIVAVGVDQERHLIAHAWSVLTGERRWTWRGEADAVPVGDGPGRLVVAGPEGRTVLDLTTGAEAGPGTGTPS